MSGARNVVCVTGASGYIASWLVKLLLQRGYIVKATVRDPNDPKKTEHLVSLDGAKERLHLFKADLVDEGSFDPVVDGCDGVFHTASPVLFSSISDPQAELIDPAVKGTLNVLKSCAKFTTVKRVVFTSSIAAVIMNGKPLTPDVVVDETWFSDPLIAEKHKLWYLLSKTLAEEAAWKFAEGNGIDLVSINPGFVIGPLLQPTINLTVEMIQNLITASGRYCLVSHLAHISEVLKIIRQLYPTLDIPERCDDDDNPYHILPSDPKFQVSVEKAKGLGISFLPFEVTLKDTIESLKEKGFLNI